MGTIFSAVVGTATGFFVKSQTGQRTLRSLASTPSGQKFLKTRLGQDIKAFISDGDTVNITRAAVTAGAATGIGLQVLTRLWRLVKPLKPSTSAP